LESPAGGVNGNGARTPARAACLPDHNPGRELEARLAARVLELARKTAALEGRVATQDDVVAVQAGVTGTKRGFTLGAIRGATTEHLEASLGAADKFDADLGAEELDLLDLPLPSEDAQPPPGDDE
jgi:hypothetical protein